MDDHLPAFEVYIAPVNVFAVNRLSYSLIYHSW